MPLFRFHRGSLEESLKTTIIVNSFNDIVKAIVFNDDFIGAPSWAVKFSINPYPLEGNFDHRIGWYTYIVKANYFKEKQMDIVGYLSEELKD